MTKLAILKFGKGSFETGFPVTLEIGEENSRPQSEVPGELPPNIELLLEFNRWQAIYRSLDFSTRPIGLSKPRTQTLSLEECLQAAKCLCDCFNHWLQSDSFRSIREKWLEKLLKSDEIRVILQSQDYQIQKLPWHLWELIERYPNAEIALSVPTYERVNLLSKPTETVKILALLGDSKGIDTIADRALLEQLPDAKVHFLVEPMCKDLTDNLWQQNWDILFFAGHSSTHISGETGLIYINQTESLTINQLKYSLRQAVERGLKLAIFNSCDGLGLAREFAALQIPQLIVMREPVPDLVAQAFLKHFLQAYAGGKSLYLAVREARERMQGLESQFPCATWLPVIYQNPAEIPPTWDELTTRGSKLQFFNADTRKAPQNPDIRPIRVASNLANGKKLVLEPLPSTQIQNLKSQAKNPKHHLLWLTGVSLAIAGLVMGIRYLGMLQPLELQAFDRLLSLRPNEKPDPRLLVVKITEEDVQSQPQEERRGSLSDASLLKLLATLEAYEPRVIGLDIYRDYAVKQDLPQLATQMQKSDRLIAVCRVSDPQSSQPGISPPPEIQHQRLGFSDLTVDADGIVRRHLLSLTPPPSSPCLATYAFSVQLALRYLAVQNISLIFTPDGGWQLGKATFKPLEAHTGGYQDLDATGYQILLNYRSHHSLQKFVSQVTLAEVLAGKVAPSAVKDRIVLIGTTAESFQDSSLTPYSTPEGRVQKIPGVILQAQMIGQLLSAALEERPLLWALSVWQETIWIWGWSLTGSLLAWYILKGRYLAIANGFAILCLYAACFVFLIQWGAWIPLVPATLALIASSLVVRYGKYQVIK
ncbi:CHASE2 domain-containing protein [Tolypothrix bouteillei VB521301]|uniref:CHASE2 domain-containing protein n=1 Tax=Tolypothrix bouteillei VB521301 TaxID=1479485 RepID=A0A0C1R8R7_9CYAN|nr:CHASE2 domain-containing protein [Tolypothrix bouteillei VB521301]